MSRLSLRSVAGSLWSSLRAYRPKDDAGVCVPLSCRPDGPQTLQAYQQRNSYCTRTRQALAGGWRKIISVRSGLGDGSDPG